MSTKSIVVTVCDCVQIGPDDFKMHYESRVFSVNRSIKDILSWAEATGIKNPTMSDLKFSEYTGESI